jgi:hypothetical protein
MQAKTSKPDCSFVRENLFSYQEKLLPDNDCKKIEEHLPSCEECSRIVSEFQTVSSFIEEKKSVELSPFTRTRILQRIQTRIRGAQHEANPFFQRILHPISFSFVLLFAVVIGFSIGKQKQTMLSDTNNHQNDLQTMKTDLNIPDFIDEDKTFFDNY